MAQLQFLTFQDENDWRHHRRWPGHLQETREGLLYVAWPLTHPPAERIHAIDLVAKVPAIYRRQAVMQDQLASQHQTV